MNLNLNLTSCFLKLTLLNVKHLVAAAKETINFFSFESQYSWAWA